jgi:hypothetical protein
MDYLKIIALALVFGVVGGFFAQTAKVPSFGATTARTTITNPWTFNNSMGVIMASTTVTRLKTGVTGAQFTNMSGSVCYIKPYAATISATTTAQVDCQGTATIGSIAGATTPLRGVTAGDGVLVQLSTSTAGTLYQTLTVVAASASTTAGHIALTLYNGTGATFTWPVSGAATGTVSYFSTR